MRRVVVGLMVGLLAHAASGASFDCKKAVRPKEKAICADADLGKVDEEVAAAYRVARRKVSPAAAALMLGDQREWLRWLSTVCDAARSVDAKKLAGCLVGPYRERAEVLEKAVLKRGETMFFTRTMYLAGADMSGEESGAPAFPGFGTMEADWVQADSAEAGWGVWNAAVERWAHEAFGDKGQPWRNEQAAGADGSVSVTLAQMTPDRVSVLVVQDSMGHGAAHPMEYAEEIHWLWKEQRELRADDVFRAGSGWRQVIARRCWAALQEEPGADELLIKSSHEKSFLTQVGSPRNWTLDRKGLTVSFQEYSVSPRAAPAPDVLVPWAALKPYVVPAFFPVR